MSKGYMPLRGVDHYGVDLSDWELPNLAGYSPKLRAAAKLAASDALECALEDQADCSIFGADDGKEVTVTVFLPLGKDETTNVQWTTLLNQAVREAVESLDKSELSKLRAGLLYLVSLIDERAEPSDP
jgi:hypothetical protein